MEKAKSSEAAAALSESGAGQSCAKAVLSAETAETAAAETEAETVVEEESQRFRQQPMRKTPLQVQNLRQPAPNF